VDVCPHEAIVKLDGRSFDLNGLVDRDGVLLSLFGRLRLGLGSRGSAIFIDAMWYDELSKLIIEPTEPYPMRVAPSYVSPDVVVPLYGTARSRRSCCWLIPSVCLALDILLGC
jgi:hypothetical protein